MKVIVNYPKNNDGNILLKEKIAYFKATLIFETVKSLNIKEEEKKGVLENIISHLKKHEITNTSKL